MSARENHQTSEFCKRLRIGNPFRVAGGSIEVESSNPDEIVLDSSDTETEDTTNNGQGETDNVIGQTEEGVVWSVDKRPGLHLPQPIKSHDDHVTASMETEIRDEDSKGQSTEPPREVQSSGSGKVIKRRNQTVYCAEESLD